MSGSPSEPTSSVDHERNAQHQLIFAARRYTSRYPLAPVRVYKLGQYRFILYVEDGFYTSEQRIGEFNREIRPVTAWIELSSQRPESTAQEIPLGQLLALPHRLSLIRTFFKNIADRFAASLQAEERRRPCGFVPARPAGVGG
jgi:hypothetical protein